MRPGRQWGTGCAGLCAGQGTVWVACRVRLGVGPLVCSRSLSGVNSLSPHSCPCPSSFPSALSTLLSSLLFRSPRFPFEPRLF